MSKSKRENSLITGLVLGGAVGAVTGLLLAPRQGKETRAVVKKSLQALPELATDFSTTTRQHTHRWSHKLSSRWEKVRYRWQKAIAAGLEAAAQENSTGLSKEDTPL